MPDADLPLKLVKLRWLWLAGLALSLAGLASAGIALPYPPLMLATAAAVVANLLWQSAPAHRLARLDMQLAWDALFLTELFFFTGGSANPLVSLYLLLIALSALTQPPRTTRALALACVLAYGVLFVWHRPLPPVPGGTDMLIALHLAGMWLTFAASAWVIGGPLARLALTLRRREQEIARLRENQLRDEQLVALGMLAASAAHELGTPLNTLTLLCDDWQAAPPAAGMEDDLVLMRDQLAACRLALARLRSRGHDNTPASAAPLAGQLSALLADWLNLRPGVLLETEFDLPGAPLPPFDPGFGPALVNLLNNAADAAGNQPLRLSARIADRQLVLNLSHPGELGVSLAQRPLNPQPSSKPNGLGLGTFLAHATLEKLGGRLEVRPQAGQVLTRLSLPLPRHADPAAD